MGHKEPFTLIGKGEFEKHCNNFKKTLIGFLDPGDGAIITHEMLYISGVNYDGQPCAFKPPTLITRKDDTYFISGEYVYRDKDTGDICSGIVTRFETDRFKEAKFVESLDDVEVDDD